MTKHTKQTTPEFSVREANEILEQCHALRESVDRLCIRAMRCLQPKLTLVEPTLNGVKTDAKQ